MCGVDELYVVARRVLLDALEALGDHSNATVVVGAQAIYLRAGEADLIVAPSTRAPRKSILGVRPSDTSRRSWAKRRFGYPPLWRPCAQFSWAFWALLARVLSARIRAMAAGISAWEATNRRVFCTIHAAAS